MGEEIIIVLSNCVEKTKYFVDNGPIASSFS
jgi:hypothetical protein